LVAWNHQFYAWNPTASLGAEQEHKLLLGLIVELDNQLLPLVQPGAAVQPQARVLQPNIASFSWSTEPPMEAWGVRAKVVGFHNGSKTQAGVHHAASSS